MEESELIKKIQKNRTTGRDYREKYRDEWDKCYDYYEGKQTPSELPGYAKYFALNLIRKRFDSLLGAILRFKYTVALKPRGDEDIPKTEFYKQIVEYILDRTKAWVEEIKAIFQQHMVGLGWIQVYWDKNKRDGLGDITWETRNAYSVWFDPHAKREDLADAHWVGREERFTVEEIKKMWPKKANLIVANEIESLKPSAEPTDADGEAKATVIEYQYYTEDTIRLYYQNGEKIELPEKLPKKELARYDVIEKVERTYWKSHLCGDVLLDTEPTNLSRFDLVCFYHSPRKDSCYPIGEVTNWIEWQNIRNVIFGLLITYVAKSAKLTGVVEGGGKPVADQLKKDIAEPGGIAYIPPGTTFKSWVPPPFPAAFDVVLKSLDSSWDDLTSYYQVQRGSTPWAGISGKAITKLQQQGSLAYVMGEHHINDSITTCGQLMLELIGKHMTVEQAFRITEDEEPVPVNKFLGAEGEVPEDVVTEVVSMESGPNRQMKPGVSKKKNEETGAIEYYLNSLSDIVNYDIRIEVDSLREETKREKAEMALALVKTNAEDGKPLVDREFVLDSLDIKEKERIVQRLQETNQVMQIGKMVMKNPLLMELIQNPELMARIQQAMGSEGQSPPVGEM